MKSDKKCKDYLKNGKKMTKLYLDNNGHYQREKTKINWGKVIAISTVYIIMFSLMVFYVYLLLSE